MAKPIYFYGTHAVLALLKQRPLDALSLFIQQGKETDKHLDCILALANTYGISVQHASKDKLSSLCASPQHQGIVLHARPLSFTHENELLTIANKPNSLLLILDQITDAHNFGACLRTAVAMGVDAVVCPKKHTAPLTPTVSKVSVGAAEIIPVIAVTNLARSMTELKKSGVFIYGTALDDSAKALVDCDFTMKSAIVMGSEGDGMRRLTTDTCDQLVYIPMNCDATTGIADIQSLNVSVATGMVLYEVRRQRL